MAARLLKWADHRRMPWKNGGGETIEIAIGPAGAGLDDFDWRVSLARVERDGPFSTFPGIDRILSVVEGCGIDLVFGPEDQASLTLADEPYGFPGDAVVSGRLLDGPIIDLNVMSRRGRANATVERITGAWHGEVAPAGAGLFYCQDGRVDVSLRGETATLGSRDALRIDGPSRVFAEIEGFAYWIEIRL